jgi:formylglycine-generating enzyme required for sulfatase activity
MKKQVLCLVLFVAFFLMAFIPIDSDNKTDATCFSIKETDKSVAKITDSLYAGKYEVTNRQYLCMINNLGKDKKTDLLKVAQIDTSNWLDSLYYDKPLVDLYFRHPAFRDYPIVNVSYEAATLYCEWLTEKYNVDPKRHFKKVLFRLPTEKEWETAARGGVEWYPYPWGFRLIEDNKQLCNYEIFGDESIIYDSLTKKLTVFPAYRDDEKTRQFSYTDHNMTCTVFSYHPNKYGLYNVCGNAAEMVKEKGVIRGGSWKNAGGDVKIESRRHYHKTAVDIGFRYFMEIKEK